MDWNQRTIKESTVIHKEMDKLIESLITSLLSFLSLFASGPMILRSSGDQEEVNLHLFRLPQSNKKVQFQGM